MSSIVKIDLGVVQMYSCIAQSLAKSGFFPIGGQYQARTPEEQAAQAFVKIMAGHELGIGPVLAMQHIHIIDGKTSLDATMVAGLIKSSGKYDYDVDRMDAKGCAITFFQIDGGQRRKLGTSTWGEADAKAAGLLGRGNWGKYPRDMFFSRCVTFGARRFCPDVFLGPIYTPEELGADIPPAGDTEQVPAPVQAIAGGDGHATTDAPVAQLKAPAEPDYDRLLDKIATRLQVVASAPDEDWNKAYDGALEYVAGWPTQYRDEAHTIAAGIADARRLAIEDAEERAAMEDEPNTAKKILRFEPADPDVGDGDNMP
jgi:hypothetical protein